MLYPRNSLAIWAAVFLTVLSNRSAVDGARIGRYVFPDIVTLEGYPVYQVGDVAIYRVSPTFNDRFEIQCGNSHPVRKILPKRAGEIGSNYIGTMTELVPDSKTVSTPTALATRLIDGDSGTRFYTIATPTADTIPVWFRIDLPYAMEVKAVHLIAAAGERYPVDLEIFTALDANQWRRAIAVTGVPQPADREAVTYRFSPHAAKQIKVRAARLRRAGPASGGYTLGLSEIEIIDTRGENVALFAKGATMIASVTGMPEYVTPTALSGRTIKEDYWPLQYDLGCKWIRFGLSSDQADTWMGIEKTPGEFVLDPVIKEKFIEAADYGLNLVYCVACMPLFHRDPGQPPPHHPILSFPETPTQHRAMAGFVRYMCGELNGKIACWELLNEYFNQVHYPGNPPASLSSQERIDNYVRVLQTVAPVIREHDPQGKIAFGGMASLCLDAVEGCFRQDTAHLVDYISWHPYYWAAPEVFVRASHPWAAKRGDIHTYPDALDELDGIAERYGFRGGYIANESWWQASYPWPPESESTWPYANETDVRKAKYCARTILLHSSRQTVFMFCKTYFAEMFVDAGLVKTTALCSLGPLMTAPPAYYVVRTLGTLLDGAEPCGHQFSISSSQPLETLQCAFTLPAGLLLAIWQTTDRADDDPGAAVTLAVPDVPHVSQVWGQDCFNGVEQPLDYTLEDGQLRIEGLLVRDYPALVRIVP